MRSAKLLSCFCVLALWAFAASAQITVSGVNDKTTYNNSATFTITVQPGYDYSATLNWQPVAVGVPVVASKPDFYELRVDATNQVGGAVTSFYRRFVVLNPARVGTETGLPTHTPFPPIQSSTAEFVGARLRLLVPASFPAGHPVPLIAWVVDEEDHAIRANGILKNGEANLFQIRRGVGSGFVSPTNASGEFALALNVGGVATNASVTIEEAVSWTAVSGTLAGNTVWPANSRIHINGHVGIPSGSTLTIGEGTVVRVNAGLEITNNGAVTINGTVQNPVVFMGATSSPWGGFVQHANNASFTATGAIFTGSGQEPCWYSNNDRGCSSGLTGQGSHRTEQPLVSMSGANCSLTMTDCAAISLAGQFSKAASGGSYTVRLTRFLVQRATSGGEYSSTTMTVNDSALIDIPDTSVNFEDEDHDALYLNSGDYAFTNTLIGWTKDDGIDSGGSGSAPLTYQSCWFEGTFHEGNSLSGGKDVFSRGTVYIDCGQGLESGYDAPVAQVDNCLFTANKTGMRWADNYTSGFTHNGWFYGTNSISIYNHRDIFAFSFLSAGWTNSPRMNASDNWISAADPNHPNNMVWNPTTDAWRLGAFGARGHVGVGFATRSTQNSLSQFPDGIPVGLSIFCSNEVTVQYTIDGTDGTHVNGTLVFPAGQTRSFIAAPTNVNGVLRIALQDPVNADVTGPASLLFQNLPPTPTTLLSPLSASWRYLDDGSEQGSAWRSNTFNDASWSDGVARLGFGSDPAPIATTIRRYVQVGGVNTSRQVTNFYFRRVITIPDPEQYSALQFRFQRDDGCVVYLNGGEMFRDAMPSGTITANTFASSTASDPADALAFRTNTIPATNLVAGDNIIAVSVHQASATSSDIGWDMEVSGLPAARLNLLPFGSEAVLFWSDAGYALEEADVVTGPWRSAVTTNSPVGTGMNGTRFFRLKR